MLQADFSGPIAGRMSIDHDAAGPPSLSRPWRWLAAALDELDYGVVLLVDDRVVHMNEAAGAELDDAHPLQMINGSLKARLPQDASHFQAAVAAASSRRLRRLLALGIGEGRVTVSVLPLDHAPDDGQGAVLIVLGKRSVSEALSIQGFARAHGLTGAETRVLMALCAGLQPLSAAQQLGVAISTVRSQIGSIRAKTGTQSIRALVRQVAILPPIKGALRAVDARAPDAASPWPRFAAG